MVASVTINRRPRTPKKYRTKRKAYIAKCLPGNSAQHHYVLNLLYGPRPRRGKSNEPEKIRWQNRHRAILHLLQSTLCQIEINYGDLRPGLTRQQAQALQIDYEAPLIYVPIPYHIWDQMGGRGTWEWLDDEGILAHYTGYDKDRHLCREFALSVDVVEGFIRAGFIDNSGPILNLFSRKRLTRVRKSPATNPDRHPWFRKGSAGDIKYQVCSEQRCYIDLSAMKAEVMLLRREADVVKTKKARHAALCAEAALLSIMQEGDLHREPKLGKGMYSYQPAYNPSYPGRLHEIGLGVQGVPRRVKKAAFSYPCAFNFDLRSALAAALLVVAERYNEYLDATKSKMKRIDCRWLSCYITRPDRGSHWLAARLRVPRDVTKEILYALMFGGRRRGAVREILMDHFNGKIDLVEAGLRRVGHVLCWKQPQGIPGLVQMLDKLDSVVSAHVCRTGPFRKYRQEVKALAIAINRTRHGTSILNSVGRSLLVMDDQGHPAIRDDGKRVAKRHVRCHVLQGVEQEFISSVIVQLSQLPECKEGKLRIMSQQHDGFVIWSDLPKEKALTIVQQCAARAQSETFFSQFAFLEEKDFL